MNEAADEQGSGPNVWEKIGFSFVGLIAGNVAQQAVLLAVRVFGPAVGIRLPASIGPGSIYETEILSLFIAIFSLLGWAVIGVPSVLVMPLRWFEELPLTLFFLPGALLGALAYTCGLLIFGGAADLLLALKATRYLAMLAALIASVALVVFVQMIRSRKRRP
ncbi:hypothetical protein [Silvibacterium dinghuense]|uniref:Uncharacterized protein n=1 Tax=Silvibacterium dinghuense TaxID=1560006 RepID=A0A4Q1SIL3_9BACT|nr:hypothetical protein [Silvibacterium dinghuense]RXS97070.1 hypothetical protein ESZ00_03845 [Silvibacterium dinghuense]GGG95942.1 hypothetical protein GCM10011586_08800 [Silvibacterium dinghuense]